MGSGRNSKLSKFLAYPPVSKGSHYKQSGKSGELLSHYKSMGVFFDIQSADNYEVGSRIWPKFKLVRDITHVLLTYKSKMDLTDSDQEKVETSIF